MDFEKSDPNPIRCHPYPSPYEEDQVPIKIEYNNNKLNKIKKWFKYYLFLSMRLGLMVKVGKK